LRTISRPGEAHHPRGAVFGRRLKLQVGASGSLGAARVAKAAPDGYTLLILSATYTINSAVMAKLPFDPTTGFAPVVMFGKGPMLLAASEDAEPTPSTPDAFGQHLSAELKGWVEWVERIGLKVP
jgi:hypothetical protein